MVSAAKPPKPDSVLISNNKTIKEVFIDEDDLDPVDEFVICGVICYCRKTPKIGVKDGRSLYQNCVSDRFKDLDKMQFHKSIYKAEISYDTLAKPPSPIMETDDINCTRPHNFVPGWIAKNWPLKYKKIYKRGSNEVRRPDLIIVRDENKAPIQSNIKYIVEIKFDDGYGKDQINDYAKIAGSRSKVKSLDLKDCDCQNRDEKQEDIQNAKDFFKALVTTALFRKLPKNIKLPTGVASPKPAPSNFKPSW